MRRQKRRCKNTRTTLRSSNLIVTWLMQQLIDAASGLPGALPLGQLAWITGGFILLCAALMLLKYASEPRFIEKAMRQYKDLSLIHI